MNSPKNNSSPVAVILVHYGSVETTLRCIDSLAVANGQKSVFIANNGSRDQGKQLAEYLKRQKEGIRGTVIQNPGNLGFAAGCNAAICQALETDAEYIWLLNNDTVVEAQAMQALLKEARKHTRTILGSTVVHLESPEIIAVAGGVSYNPLTTTIKAAHAARHVNDRETLAKPALDYIYGASFFFPRTMLDDIGMLDEDFFLYYEELDFCGRARKAGYELGWCRDSIVLHHGGAATGTRTGYTSRTSRIALFHEARSTVLYTRKHHLWFLPIVLFARIAGKTLFLLKRKEFKSIIPALLGAWDGLLAKQTKMRQDENK